MKPTRFMNYVDRQVEELFRLENQLSMSAVFADVPHIYAGGADNYNIGRGKLSANHPFDAVSFRGFQNGVSITQQNHPKYRDEILWGVERMTGLSKNIRTIDDLTTQPILDSKTFGYMILGQFSLIDYKEAHERSHKSSDLEKVMGEGNFNGATYFVSGDLRTVTAIQTFAKALEHDIQVGDEIELAVKKLLAPYKRKIEPST